MVLAPSNEAPSVLIRQVVDDLASRGVPDAIADFDRLEVLANVVMVVPVGLLAALAFPRPSWRDWAAYGFLASFAVELAQGLVLPARQAAASDVVANTLGLLVGALVAGLVRRRRDRLRRSRRPRLG